MCQGFLSGMNWLGDIQGEIPIKIKNNMTCVYKCVQRVESMTVI